MSNHKFKVGDKVIAVQDIDVCIPKGSVLTVKSVSNKGNYIYPEVNNGWYTVDNFEHYVEQPVVDSEAVLAPLKVFEHILAGTPLEYSVKNMSGDSTWYTVENPKHIDVGDIECADYRVTPQTVKVNGIDVPAPAKLPTNTLVWYPDIRRVDVQQGYVGTSGMGNYWSTEEDAQAVLDAILTSFSK